MEYQQKLNWFWKLRIEEIAEFDDEIVQVLSDTCRDSSTCWWLVVGQYPTNSLIRALSAAESEPKLRQFVIGR